MKDKALLTYVSKCIMKMNQEIKDSATGYVNMNKKLIDDRYYYIDFNGEEYRADKNDPNATSILARDVVAAAMEAIAIHSMVTSTGQLPYIQFEEYVDGEDSVIPKPPKPAVH